MAELYKVADIKISSTKIGSKKLGQIAPAP